MRIGVFGAGGTVGKEVVRRVLATPGLVLAGGTSRPKSAVIGKDIAAVAGLKPIGMAISADPAQVFAVSDVVIDFALSSATLRHLKLAAKAKVPIVLGVTGFKAAHRSAIRLAAKRTAVVEAPNTAYAVNLAMTYIERVARILAGDFDVEIVTIGDRKLPFAPSGTALQLVDAAARGLGVKRDKALVKVRDGDIGVRKPTAIGLHNIRGGIRPGNSQRGVFFGDSEVIEIAGITSSPAIYADGAVVAAQWVKGKRPGHYGMREVFDLG